MESESLIKGKRGRNKSCDYGSVGYSSADQRVKTFDDVAYSRLVDDDDEQLVHIRFVFRKRDAIIVAILLLLVIVSILTTLLIGIPAIRAKNEVPRLNNTWLLPDQSLPVVYPDKTDVGVFSSVPVSTNCPQCSTIAS